MKQNTPEWLEFRKKHIGASDAPIIMEVSPWTTPYQLWEEKLELAPKRQETAPQTRGKALEDLARQELEKLTGLLFFPEVRLHPDREWMMASFDAIDPEHKYIGEIKCPGKEDHAIAQSGQIPDKYFPQLQHQLEVAQLEMVYYFSFDGTKGVLLKIYRDEKYIKQMIEKEQHFWENMQTWTAPELTDRDYELINDPLRLEMAQELISIRSQLMPLEKREKDLEEQLKALTPRNAMGGGLKISRYLKAGSVDYKQIPELTNVNLEIYRKKPVSCARITVI